MSLAKDQLGELFSFQFNLHRRYFDVPLTTVRYLTATKALPCGPIRVSIPRTGSIVSFASQYFNWINFHHAYSKPSVPEPQVAFLHNTLLRKTCLMRYEPLKIEDGDGYAGTDSHQMLRPQTTGARFNVGQT